MLCVQKICMAWLLLKKSCHKIFEWFHTDLQKLTFVFVVANAQ